MKKVVSLSLVLLCMCVSVLANNHRHHSQYAHILTSAPVLPDARGSTHTPKVLGFGRATMATRCVIANTDCFVLKACVGTLTPEKRMDCVNDRLAYILGYKNFSWGTEKVGRSRAIYVGGKLLVTVTPADARANGTTVDSLCATWVANVGNALNQEK